MPDTVTCGRCNTWLAVRDDNRDRWLTCPNCLSSIPNPMQDRVTADAPVSAPARQCRVCGESLQPAWRACPHCGEPARPSARRAAGVENDVRQDRAGSYAGLIVLAVMLGGGVILFLAVGGLDLVSASEEGATIALLALGLIIAVVVGVGVLLFTARDPSSKAIGATLGGIAVGATIALAIVLLTVAAICAGISNFFNSCGGKQNPPAKQKPR